MKTYTEIRSTNRDIIFILNDGVISLKIIMRFNSMVESYSGLELQAWEDSFEYIKNNQWLLDLNCLNIKDQLKINNFIEVRPTPMQGFIYSGDITSNQN